MSDQIRARNGIMDIELYQGGASYVHGVETILKLSSNENPLGPSPQAQRAFTDAAQNLHRYPSTSHEELRCAISHVHDLPSAQIICTVGSDELLHLLAGAFAGPRDNVIHTQHGFAIYKIATLAAGATPVEVAERDRTVDVDAILAACNARTKLVYIANPANPTGTMIENSDLERLANGLPKHCLLVLDGAYAEYVEGYDAGRALIAQHSNVIMTRTFSKIYGLGGLRIGWGYAARPIIDVLNRIRGPFNLSSAALSAAEASMRDQDYVTSCRAENAENRAWLAHELAHLGIMSDTSSANFILARLPSEQGAKACLDALAKDGILVRHPKSYQLPTCLRITIGTRADCERVVQAIKIFQER